MLLILATSVAFVRPALERGPIRASTLINTRGDEKSSIVFNKSGYFFDRITLPQAVTRSTRPRDALAGAFASKKLTIR